MPFGDGTWKGDFAGVQNGTIEIDENILAEFDIRPIINSNRRFNPSIVSEEFFVVFFRLCFVREWRLVANDTG